MTRALPVVVVLAVVLVSGTAGAQPQRQPPAEPSPMPAPDPATLRAREAYDRGRGLYATGQWAEALTAFREAHQAQPHPTVLLSIAECQDRLGDERAAVATLEQYLAASPGARDRDAVTERIATIRSRPATLNVTSDPPGAAIEVDGQTTDLTTPAELELPPGVHAIRLRLDGHVEQRQEVTLEYAERRDAAFTLAEEVAPAEGPAPAPPPPRRPVRRYTSTWLAASVTGVALVAGAIFGTLALATQADYEDTPTFELANRGNRLALAADVAFGVAIAAGLTTAFAWVHAAGGEDAEPARRVAVVPILPTLHAGGAGLAAHLDF